MIAGLPFKKALSAASLRVLSASLPVALLLVPFATTSVHAQERGYNRAPGARVTQFSENADAGEIVLKTEGQVVAGRPQFKYLPGSNGDTVLTADFEGLSWSYPTKIIRLNSPEKGLRNLKSAGIKEIRIGQFQASPSILRVSFIAHDPAVLKKVAIGAAPGVLKLSWPEAGSVSTQIAKKPAAKAPANAISESDKMPPLASAIGSKESVAAASSEQARGWLKRLKTKTKGYFGSSVDTTKDEPAKNELAKVEPPVAVAAVAAKAPVKAPPKVVEKPVDRIVERPLERTPERTPEKAIPVVSKNETMPKVAPARTSTAGSAISNNLSTDFGLVGPIDADVSAFNSLPASALPAGVVSSSSSREVRTANGVTTTTSTTTTTTSSSSSSSGSSSAKSTAAPAQGLYDFENQAPEVPPAPPPLITLSTADGQGSGAKLELFRVERPDGKQLNFKSFRLHNPERYVVDMPEYRELADSLLPDITESPLVSSIRVGLPGEQEGAGRLVLQLADDTVSVDEFYNAGSNYMTVTLAKGLTGNAGISRTGSSVANLAPTGPIVVPRAPNETVVVLDAGHGGNDPGAVRGDVQEKELTMQIIAKLKKVLEAKGARIVLTRSDDTFVSLEDRVKITNAVSPNLFLSVHINSLESTSNIYGIETYFQTDRSRPLAVRVHGSLVGGLGAPDRSVRKARFYVINHTPVPAILAEVGYITHKGERDRLVSSEYQQKVANALARGVMNYLNDVKSQSDVANSSSNSVGTSEMIKPSRVATGNWKPTK